MYLRLAAANIVRNGTRSLITLGAIAAGSAAVVLAGGFIQDSISQLTGDYIRNFVGHVQICRRGFTENGLARPFDFMIGEPDRVLDAAKALPSVARAAPRLEFVGLLARGDSSLSFVAQGLDPRSEQANSLRMLEGDNLDEQDRYAVLLGTGLARALGARAGDSVVLLANTQSGAINGLDMSVKGVFQTASKEYDDRVARLPLPAAQRILRTAQIQTITLYLDRLESTHPVAAALEQEFKKRGWDLEVVPWYRHPSADFVVKTEDFFRSLFRVLKGIILIVVILSIFNTMNMAVLERIGEIGTMLALGSRRRGVLTLFLAEGLLLGVSGGVLGLLLGLGLALGISAIGIPMPTAPGSTDLWIARIAVVPAVFVSAFLMALGTALVSALYPAFKASRMEISQALRHNI